MDLVRNAMLMAYQAHRHQTYGKGDDAHPYLVHLFDTYRVAVRYNLDQRVRAAAWVHDTLEDTTVGYAQLVKELGEDVAELVYLVTDEVGRNRKERKAKTLPKLVESLTTPLGRMALDLKLADWIANVTDATSRNPKMLQMYQKDWPGFVQACGHEGHPDMWGDLLEMLAR